MDDTTKTIVLCETKSGGSRALFDLLRQDIPEAAFLHYRRSQLLDEQGKVQPYCIVCDYASAGFQEAKEEIASLRETFPYSGIIIYRNTTDLEPETFGLKFVTCYDSLLNKFASLKNDTREFINQAYSLAQPRI